MRLGRIELDASAYRSRIARRIFAIFLTCSLLPITFFAFFSFHQVSRQLERDARVQLRGESKSAGMSIIERLVLLELGLKSIGPEAIRGGSGLLVGEGRFRRVFFSPGEGVPVDLRATLPELEPASARELSHLGGGGSLLRVQRDDDGTAHLFMFRNAPPGSGHDWVVGELDSRGIWRPETLRAGVDLTVLGTAGEVLFTSLPSMASGSSRPEDESDSLQEEWSLFLDSLFLAESWTVVHHEAWSAVFEPLTEFRQLYPLVALLSLWVVLFLSLWQIRLSLVPIEILRAATRRIARHDFETRVKIESKDEFRELGDAFNHMAEQIGDLTGNLEAKVAERTRELAEALRDLRLTQSRLVHREKMASVGQFVAGIAHEINNPLAFIAGNLHFLRTYSGTVSQALSAYEEAAMADPELKNKFSAIREEFDLDFVMGDMASVFDGCADGVQRTSGLVDDLRTFSRLDDGDCLSVDLNEALDSTINVLRGKLGGVDLVREYGELPTVECQAGQINQVLMNLIVNAVDAIGEDERVTVRTIAIDDGRVAVEVEDEGCGIEPDVLDKIFDPFFTTKDVGAGTGLGLSVSFGVIERHGGRIDVRSTPGAGTCFRVELPTVFSGGSSEEEHQVVEE